LKNKGSKSILIKLLMTSISFDFCQTLFTVCSKRWVCCYARDSHFFCIDVNHGSMNSGKESNSSPSFANPLPRLFWCWCSLEWQFHWEAHHCCETSDTHFIVLTRLPFSVVDKHLICCISSLHFSFSIISPVSGLLLSSWAATTLPLAKHSEICFF
jgi:hypothetical protein